MFITHYICKLLLTGRNPNKIISLSLSLYICLLLIQLIHSFITYYCNKLNKNYSSISMAFSLLATVSVTKVSTVTGLSPSYASVRSSSGPKVSQAVKCSSIGLLVLALLIKIIRIFHQQ